MARARDASDGQHLHDVKHGGGGDLVASILDAPVAIAECGTHTFAPLEGDLFPEERRAIRNAVDQRRREFAAGRILARQAMSRLGCHAAAIAAGEDRAPVWPEGLVGSITHAADWCAVAVGHRRDLRSVGIDVEAADPLETELWRIVCTPDEIEWLDALPAATRGLVAKLVFSAKEALYKVQYPITREFCDFQTVTVRTSIETRRWHATFQRAVGDAFAPGDRVNGRLAVRGRLLATAAWIA